MPCLTTLRGHLNENKKLRPVSISTLKNSQESVKSVEKVDGGVNVVLEKADLWGSSEFLFFRLTMRRRTSF